MTVVKAAIGLGEVPINPSSSDYVPSFLAHIMNTEAVNDLVVRTWQTRASKYAIKTPFSVLMISTRPPLADRKSTLIFCVNIKHVLDVTDVFIQAGIDARSITGATPTSQRKSLLDDFRSGVFPVLVNCGKRKSPFAGIVVTLIFLCQLF